MVRFGIVGTNWITEAFLEGGRAVSGFELAAVYSRSGERARDFAEKHGAAHTFTDIAEMAESELIDAVYIASPNSFHAEQSILFMENGKHVLCEKPLASNTAEVEAMFEAARGQGVVLMEAMKTTFLPGFKTIQEHLHKIGKPRRYFASFCKYSSRYDAYRRGEVLNAFNPEFSNGALMDLGIYCLYPLVVLYGEPEDVMANGVLLESGVDGEGSLLLHYGDMDAVIMHSKIADSNLPCEIQGEEGSMVIDKISEPERVEIRYRAGSKEVFDAKMERPSMSYEVEAFLDLLGNRETESQMNSYRHSAVTAAIMEKARKQFGLLYPADRK
ncbi:Gfo/Idh/MocA family protein [Bacillus marinisedimentorum]|uniref:Gfo/Idh/MocA family protein n=1 Tax=Bacillus marinisedimentorum TaxID=1821260 RepID=UPI000871EADE|nr:Gfo/Idh/MocA family oxidoreductase [Bacillus marinisedimentorum]